MNELFRASGSGLTVVDGDFPVDRFNCYVGESPSFHLARALQENCGIVRYKKGQLRFWRLPDLFKQEPIIKLVDNEQQDINAGFTERHHVQSFYSIAPDGSFVYGNRNKARTARFMPHMNEMQLHNLTRCLVQKKIARIYYDEEICAGDLVEIEGKLPRKLVVVTAAHAVLSGTDGAAPEQFTRLWLSSLEN